MRAFKIIRIIYGTNFKCTVLLVTTIHESYGSMRIKCPQFTKLIFTILS